MKKAIVAVLAAAMCAFPAVGLVACGDEEAVDGLQFGVKYISSDVVESADPQYYYVFFANGTGNYYGLSGRTDFKFTFAGNDNSEATLFYPDGDGGVRAEVLGVSRNVLTRAWSNGYSVYVNENYAKQLKDWAAK